MSFIGAHCPVCGKAFTETDDIVVCPVCGTPHHRACYAEKGACANEARHAEGYVWQPERPAEQALPSAKQDAAHPTVTCPRCGAQNPAEEPVCTICGERLYHAPNAQQPPYGAQQPPYGTQQPPYGIPQPTVIPSNETIGGNTVADTAAYVQMGAGRYVPKFYEMEKTRKKVRWNWAAFLFTPYWFFYRKVYAAGAVFLVLGVLLSLCTATPRFQESFAAIYDAQQQYLAGTLDEASYMAEAEVFYTLPETIGFFAGGVVLHIAAGLCANYFYKRKVQKDIADLRAHAESPERYRLGLLRRGGVSALLCVAVIFIYSAAQQLLGVAIFNLLS